MCLESVWNFAARIVSLPSGNHSTKSRQMSRAFIAASRLTSRGNYGIAIGRTVGRDYSATLTISMAGYQSRSPFNNSTLNSVRTGCCTRRVLNSFLEQPRSTLVKQTSSLSQQDLHIIDPNFHRSSSANANPLAGKSQGTMRSICDVSQTCFRGAGSTRSSYSQRLAISQWMRSKRAPLRRTGGNHACSSCRRTNWNRTAFWIDTPGPIRGSKREG